MKVEIGESLGYSFLRHVAGCWLVQANWKASEHWDEHKLLSDKELEQEFSDMRLKFDPDGSVFGKIRGYRPLLKQAEVDIVGVKLDRSIYTVEVAFHEGGLTYGSRAETHKRVLKKMLRTKLILDAYHPEEVDRHIYFASPKVGDRLQGDLEDVFFRLRQEYPAVDWQLLTNNEFTNQFLRPLRERSSQVADTSELFVRSLQLLELMGSVKLGEGD